MDEKYSDRLDDTDWMRQTFLLSRGDITRRDMLNRVMTNADFTFGDTTLGGSAAINMPYQFTRYADLKTGLSYRGNLSQLNSSRNRESGGQFSYRVAPEGEKNSIIGNIIEQFEYTRNATAGNFGMGRYYQESIDEHSVLVHMRFGVPVYNSMTRFLGSFYSHRAAELAQAGRGQVDWTRPGEAIPGAINNVAGAMGSLTGALFAAPFYPFVLGGRVLRTLAGVPSSKFYYLKPTMALYRQAAATILNGIAVNMGISPYSPNDDRVSVYNTGDQEVMSENNRAIYHNLLPDVVQPDGHIDLFAVTTRYQRKANRINSALREELGQSLLTPWSQMADNMRGVIAKMQDGTLSGGGDAQPTQIKGISKYLELYFGVDINISAGDGGSSMVNTLDGNIRGDNETGPEGSTLEMPGSSAARDIAAKSSQQAANTTGGREIFGGTDEGARVGEGVGGTVGQYASMFEAELHDGGQFVTFRVDNPGPMTESFTNQVRESDLSQKLNSISAAARSKRFDFAQGNIGFGIGTVVSAVESFVGNALDKIEMSGVMGLSGLAFIDIPQTWDNSTAQLPRADFTIQLRAAYGNKLSRFMDLYVPLSLLLAGVLPLSTGMQSYTSPFICEVYCKDRAAIRLGIIESMTITRATNNMPMSIDGGPMGIDVSFQVRDLSSVLHMPIATNFGLVGKIQAAGNAAMQEVSETVGNGSEAVQAALTPSAYGEDSAFNDYLAVLGGLSLDQMVYGTRKLALQYARQRQNIRAWRSPAALAAMGSDTLTGRVARMLAMGTNRAINE